LHLPGRPRWRLPASREARLALIGLAALLVAGALLRLLFTVAWRPAFMGWPDAASYMDVSQGELFSSTLRPAGYPLLLKGLYALAPTLSLVVFVHHMLGLASAALLYLAVARSGAPRLLGLVPAAILALGGDFMFLEHSPISESPFIFLVAAALYAGIRAQEGKSLRWAALCGLALALAASVRVVGGPLLVVVGLWALGGSGLAFRRRLCVLAVGTAGAAAVLVPYYVAEYAAVGDTGLSRNGVWNVYGRVAPFADCSKFTPPPGTERLCESTSRPRRPFTYQYTFNWYYSPAVRYFGNPHSATPEQTGQVAAFARAVIVGQPLTTRRRWVPDCSATSPRSPFAATAVDPAMTTSCTGRSSSTASSAGRGSAWRESTATPTPAASASTTGCSTRFAPTSPQRGSRERCSS